MYRLILEELIKIVIHRLIQEHVHFSKNLVLFYSFYYDFKIVSHASCDFPIKFILQCFVIFVVK